MLELINISDGSPALAQLSEDEAALRNRLISRTRTIFSKQSYVPMPAIMMVTFFLMVVAWGSVSFWAAMGVLAAGIATLFGLIFWDNRRLKASGSTAIINTALGETLPWVTTSRIERAYSEVIRELLPQNIGTLPLSAELRREQMAQLNALLDSGRRLDAVRAAIAATLWTASPETLRAEADSLRERQERATDPATRAAFAQSLTLCEERLRRAESLTHLTERIEAEQELVYQAFRAAQSSIASLRVSPTAAGLGDAAGTASVAEVAETIGQQTRAVEAAVQELGIRN